MRCKFNHDHPPKHVMATDNPMEPWGPRPFHCPCCFQVRRKDNVESWWKPYQDPNEVIDKNGNPRPPCKNCFPNVER